MNRFYSGLQSLWSNSIKCLAVMAATALVLSPVAVSAQSAASVSAQATQPAATNARVPLRPTVYTDGDEVSARTFFGFREYIRGIPTTDVNYGYLKDYGCYIGPTSFAKKITDRFIAKGEMCQKSMFDKLDGLNKEGSPLVIVFVEGGVATVVKSVKGINVSQNYLEISTYSLAANSDGKPLTVTYNYHANGGQYMAQMLTSLPGTILGATLPGITAKLLNSCDGNCQSGIINVVSAASDSTSVAAVQTEQTTVVGAAVGCGGAQCAPAYTHPRN